MFTFRRRETPWEVVESKSVDPVPMYYSDDDLNVAAVGNTNICGTYVFDVNKIKKRINPQDAVVFARQQLLQQKKKKGYNVLVLESWRLTIFRRGTEHRMEVQYSGRPAQVTDESRCRKSPPFMEMLQACQ